MNEEKIRKVLTGEADISKMDRDEFDELLKCLGSMYLARVMNCVDGTGKSDKEWTALSSIFGRAAEATAEKPSGDCAKLREALEAIISGYENADLCDMNYGEWCHDPANVCVNVPLCKAIHEARAALAATEKEGGAK